MTARNRIETVAFQTPTPAETARVMAEARRLRAKALAGMLARAWASLRGLLHGENHARPAH